MTTRLKRSRRAAVCAGASLFLVGARNATAQSPVVIRNATVIDVQSGTLHPSQTVVIEGTRITAVDDATRLATPKGARVVDGSGKFLIPGLWDMHVHATGPGIDRLFLPVLVANGVTGVREMFGTFKWYADARAMAQRGEIVMPRLVGSGHILDGKPQIWQSVEVVDADQTRHAVDSLARGGAAFIKVYSRLTPDEFRAAADEAKRHGLPFAGHVPTLVSVDEALTLGMASIEHLQMFTTACSSQEESLRATLLAAVATPKGWDSAGVIQRLQLPLLPRSFDRARCAALAKRVAASNTWMVPTVVVLHSTSYLDDPSLRGDSRLQYIPEFFKNGWNPANDLRFRAVTPEGWAARKRIFDEQLEILRILHDGGAKFLAGTDLSNPYLYPGFSLYDELAYFTKNGFSSLEALQTATINPARFLNATDSLGTIAPGKLADLVVLDANPLTDIANVARVHAVVANGVLIDASRRQQILKSAVSIATKKSAGRRG
ncbi:MAG TPA: amidohydrolase family protein [Gemmatimonadaceae bacterium]|nr:amidohydrolase family protein [Gemmatimonadaceae bacterium]